MNGMSSSTGQAAQDPERRVIRIGGAEAADFLQSILTSDMEALSPGETRASALLTPQGRILADMMVLRVDDGFMLDCDASRADDLFTRLRRYKLRCLLYTSPSPQRWDGAGSGRRDQVPKQHQGPDRRTSTSGMRCASPPVCRRARSTCNRNGR